MTIKLRQLAYDANGKPLSKEAEEAVRETQEDLGFGPDTLINIAKVMPPVMNGPGLITVIINMMANYDMLPQSGLIIMELTRALAELKAERPDFFEEGGVERSREEANKNLPDMPHGVLH